MGASREMEREREKREQAQGTLRGPVTEQLAKGDAYCAIFSASQNVISQTYTVAPVYPSNKVRVPAPL